MLLLELEDPLIQQVLKPDYAACFIYHSFKHSQGNQWLQRQIVSYAHLIRPLWEVKESDARAISIALNQLLQSYDKMREKGLHVSNEATSPLGTSRAADQALYLMINFLKGENEPKPTIVEAITYGIIERDHYFFAKPNGRNKTSPDINSPSRDNWLSHAIHFGLNGNPTGLKEFDEMYRDARAYILSRKLDQESQGKFDKVLAIYTDKHPGVAINLQP